MLRTLLHPPQLHTYLGAYIYDVGVGWGRGKLFPGVINGKVFRVQLNPLHFLHHAGSCRRITVAIVIVNPLGDRRSSFGPWTSGFGFWGLVSRGLVLGALGLDLLCTMCYIFGIMFKNVLL